MTIKQERRLRGGGRGRSGRSPSIVDVGGTESLISPRTPNISYIININYIIKCHCIFTICRLSQKISPPPSPQILIFVRTVQLFFSRSVPLNPGIKSASLLLSRLMYITWNVQDIESRTIHKLTSDPAAQLIRRDIRATPQVSKLQRAFLPCPISGLFETCIGSAKYLKVYTLNPKRCHFFPFVRNSRSGGGRVQIEFVFDIFIVVAPIFVYAKGYPSIHTVLGVYALEYIAYTAAPPMNPCKNKHVRISNFKLIHNI